jgi:hypothetical protein
MQRASAGRGVRSSSDLHTIKEEFRMRYFCLICGEAEEWDGGRLTEGVGEGGHRIGGSRWEPAQGAPAGPVREGKVLSTDGPFAETKE